MGAYESEISVSLQYGHYDLAREPDITIKLFINKL